MSMSVFRLRGRRLIPVRSDATSPDDLTRGLPRGFYSTFITNHNGTRALGLAAHLDRLYLRGILPSASRADLRQALANLASVNAPGESRFRLLLSANDGTIHIIIQPFAGLPGHIYECGVKVITTELTRRNPRLKDSGFIAESQPERVKIDGGIFEALLTRSGRIYEGMTSNFYAIVQPGRLVTARRGILLGVTRRAILRVARGEGMEIVYRSPRVDEKFAEAFLTSSSRGVVPIVEIDRQPVGEGRPGAWTKRLSLAYQTYVEERSELFAGE